MRDPTLPWSRVCSYATRLMQDAIHKQPIKQPIKLLHDGGEGSSSAHGDDGGSATGNGAGGPVRRGHSQRGKNKVARPARQNRQRRERAGDGGD